MILSEDDAVWAANKFVEKNTIDSASNIFL